MQTVVLLFVVWCLLSVGCLLLLVVDWGVVFVLFLERQLVADCCMVFVIVCVLFGVCRLLLDECCLLSVVRWLSFVVCRVVFIVCCLRFVVSCSMTVVCWKWLIVVCWLLFAACC